MRLSLLSCLKPQEVPVCSKKRLKRGKTPHGAYLLNLSRGINPETEKKKEKGLKREKNRGN